MYHTNTGGNKSTHAVAVWTESSHDPLVIQSKQEISSHIVVHEPLSVFVSYIQMQLGTFMTENMHISNQMHYTLVN